MGQNYHSKESIISSHQYLSTSSNESSVNNRLVTHIGSRSQNLELVTQNTPNLISSCTGYHLPLLQIPPVSIPVGSGTEQQLQTSLNKTKILIHSVPPAFSTPTSSSASTLLTLNSNQPMSTNNSTLTKNIAGSIILTPFSQDPSNQSSPANCTQFALPLTSISQSTIGPLVQHGSSFQLSSNFGQSSSQMAKVKPISIMKRKTTNNTDVNNTTACTIVSGNFV